MTDQQETKWKQTVRRAGYAIDSNDNPELCGPLLDVRCDPELILTINDELKRLRELVAKHEGSSLFMPVQ